MSESKDPSEQNEPDESRPPNDPFAPGTPPPGWTQPDAGKPWEYQQPPAPYWSAPQPGERIGPPQEQIPDVPPHWQQPYGGPGQPPPPYGQQPPAGQWGPPPGQPPQYAQQYGQPQYAAAPLPGIPPGVEMGGLGKRLIARIIDALVLLPVWIVVGIATWDSGFGGQILGAVVQSAVFFAYDTYFIAKKGGQTIGKRTQGLRVVSLSSGGVPDQNSAAKRSAIYNFSWIACYIGSILVALSPLFDSTKRKQGWHDKVGNTVVIKA
ncbi:MAG TPA: RDD family protein [Nonomuraea sp.]|nr:RDD family protein [Nonomuraea sp.]